ncbi:MAG: DUF4139 domain-containing protein [Candidatus Obscuribacterales bacterium]|nr:DUF4139 domain-containing protein [Candidatus Obscuribacterales bacterium]
MQKSKSLTYKFLITGLAISALGLGTNSAFAADVSASDSEGIALTIYNQNFGLVKDVRKVNLKQGVNFLRFKDVAAAIDPTTVNFMSLTAPNSVVVREQNYQYDVMDPNTILSKSVGKTVTFRQFLQGGEKTVTGVLLNPPQVSIVDTSGYVQQKTMGLVLKTDSGILLNPAGQAELAELPKGLVSKPSLLWKLQTNKQGDHRTEISYQTKGLNWHCDYVAIANQDDTKADLTSWVTIDNQSGAAYQNASLKLLAGDVHKVEPPIVVLKTMARGRAAPSAMPQQFTEKAFAEYHLYSLAGTTNVNNNETKQMSLFNVNGVPTRKLFIFEPQQNNYVPYRGRGQTANKVNVKLEIANNKKNNLGIPLPKGKVRVYKRDDDGALQFIGEDLIDHTPRDEKVRLYIGDAFDLVGERKQLSQESPNSRTQKMTIEISLRNHKDKDVSITAVEHAYGDWKIENSSHEYKKKDSHTLEFAVNVPAGEEVKINYTIRIRY